MSIFPSVRYSPAVDLAGNATKVAFVKLYLGHAKGRTVFIPAHVVLTKDDGSASFFQPSFFGPPSISFLPDEQAQARFSIDVAAPQGHTAQRILVRIKRSGLRRTFRDGAQLYVCQLTCPANLEMFAAGEAYLRPDDDFDFLLHHHTDDLGHDGIYQTKEIRGSPWNVQGVRKLENVAHAYFTTMKHIRGDRDLARIAMSREGLLPFQTTEDGERVSVFPMEVYRGDTTGRTRCVSLRVASALISPTHLYYHQISRGHPAYYEVIGPEILRVPIEPGSSLKFEGNQVITPASALKVFNYVVLGHADTAQGLKAPYDEESTEEVMFLEPLTALTDVMAFWKANQNTDLYSGRLREVRTLGKD